MPKYTNLKQFDERVNQYFDWLFTGKFETFAKTSCPLCSTTKLCSKCVLATCHRSICPCLRSPDRKSFRETLSLSVQGHHDDKRAAELDAQTYELGLKWLDKMCKIVARQVRAGLC